MSLYLLVSCRGWHLVEASLLYFSERLIHIFDIFFHWLDWVNRLENWGKVVKVRLIYWVNLSSRVVDIWKLFIDKRHHIGVFVETIAITQGAKRVPSVRRLILLLHMDIVNFALSGPSSLHIALTITCLAICSAILILFCLKLLYLSFNLFREGSVWLFILFLVFRLHGSKLRFIFWLCRFDLRLNGWQMALSTWTHLGLCTWSC